MVHTAKLSVEEYHRIVATGALGDRRIELLNGELIEASPETPAHANQNNKLFKYLLAQFDGLADVRSGHPITLPTSEPEPDIVLAQLPESRYDTRHPEPDDIVLVIEVSYSTLEYDLDVKRQIYARAGIKEYWIADLKNHRLILFRDLESRHPGFTNPETTDPETCDYQQRLELTEGVVSLSVLPQVALRVERLLSPTA